MLAMSSPATMLKLLFSYCPFHNNVKDVCMFDRLCNSKEFLSDSIFWTLYVTLVLKVTYKRCDLRGPTSKRLR